MISFTNFLVLFLDPLTGHLTLTVYLMAVTDEHAVWKRLKKLPLLLLSPLIITLLSIGLYYVPGLQTIWYYISSLSILVLCSLWVQWTWRFKLWQALAATCMAGIFQVAESTLSRVLLWNLPLNEIMPHIPVFGIYLGISILVSLLLYKLRFGAWFRLLLDNESAPWQTALLLLAQEVVMEICLRLLSGVQSKFLALYYLLVAAMVILIAMLIIYLAQQFDSARKLQMQQDVIAQQQLYEQDLETIRREVRTFRHDYKNLLAGLSQQAGAGELKKLRHTLSELDVGFELRLGNKIQTTAQIGNLQIPEVRSLMLNKLTIMQNKGIECVLEVLYPVMAVNMDVWDFVRCLGILIENAIEAALDTKQPWVEIVLLSQNGRVFFRVSNSYINTVEPGKMWNDGWSTKGVGRGLGLSSYQHILESYPNASPCTSWENGVFVQELTVEGRP